VIAGHAAAVARAVDIAAAKGARRALALPISVPAHSSLMQPAAEQLRLRLASTAFTPNSRIAVYGVDVKTHSSAENIRAGLVRQMYTPVYWAATVRHDDCGRRDPDRGMRSGQSIDGLEPESRQEPGAQNAGAGGCCRPGRGARGGKSLIDGHSW